MKMRASGEAAASYQSHHIAALHTLPFLHKSLGQMSVERLDTKSMIEFDHISQLRIKPYIRDTTLCGRLHWRVGGSPDVQPIVPRRLFCKWGHARSES